MKLLSRLKKDTVFQNAVSFLSFMILAAIIMLVLESTESESGINSFFHSLWFSIVTVTTVGYGDMSPVSAIGKLAAIAIMFIGIFYVAVLTGNITSWLVERNRKRTLGLVPVKEVGSPIMICGWKKGMGDLVKEILALHKKDSSQMVLVNDADPHEVNELRQDPKLRDFHYFSGDYTNTEVLINAGVGKAEKALILADELSGKTADEIDFKSVLATIAIKRLYPHIYTIVEIIHAKFRLYLENVEAEEIIFNRFIARALVCNIVLSSGVNSIFKKFFSMESGILRILSVDAKWVGDTYEEIRQRVEDAVVIGILENTGNLRIRKDEKMGQIQKSVTIKDAILGLTEIKKMESNRPVFHPAPDYLLSENSSLIVLKVSPHQLNQKHPQELINEEKIHQKSTKEMILHQLDKFSGKSTTWDEFIDGLEKIGLEPDYYENELNGFIFKETRYPFSELAVSKRLLDKIQALKNKKIKIEASIALKIETALRKSENWSDFYKFLQLDGLEIYLYRNRPFGFLYNGKRYSHKSLGLNSELIEQLARHKNFIPVSKKGETIPERESSYLTLFDFMSEFRGKKQLISSKSESESGVLIICGWKPQLIEMLDFIINQHQFHKVDWNKISVVANIDAATAENFNSHFRDVPFVELFNGDFADRQTLKQAGLLHAKKVIILAETDSGKTFEEIDAQTVLAAMLIGSMNKQVYKAAEILDQRYEESLIQANVEEIFLEDEFIRIMLANSSHGLGITKILSELINLNHTLIDIRDIEAKYINHNFIELYKGYNQPGKMPIGLLEDTGNYYARKSEKIYQAQIQSNIKGQVEELIKVKSLIPNHVVISPTHDYRINPNSKLILINTNNDDSWSRYSEFIV
ncbi:MAG: potassium channel protein [Deltaproteobacteria bacterium]|nr:potassium channel protein [Deltaproteobacteria bacterium]MBT4266302.1 potassium channel protein [Deltaproteobacteria bacterium]MBT4640012.1 potassium channel protein [Deltaproteobacteria bacterium]MBT6503105.1 potassium channel protein [Deltaproteobacteria bacterium]MBT7152355.1 potassium channel protein [Deltaproteobacteria bacterium]